MSIEPIKNRLTKYFSVMNQPYLPLHDGDVKKKD